MGSNERNIFILTTNPKATFQQAKGVLERQDCLRAVSAAYRPVEGENYVIIWPEGLQEEFRIT